MRTRGKVIKIFSIITGQLLRLAVWVLLLYRRMRYGYAFRLIPMSQPKYAKVDPCDYERLRKYEWLAKKGKNSFYAQKRVPAGTPGKEKLVYMHQMLIQVPDGKVVDHVNHEGMDNRRINLRAATYSQNLYNRKKRSGATQSKYKGIYWRKKVRKWQASIKYNKKRIELGYYRDEIEAAKAYDLAAIKYHGEFACLNFAESAGGHG
jgi:hypothetical protein